MARKLYVTKTRNLCFLKSPGPEPIIFQMGMFETSNEAEQKFLETHPSFGQKIHLAKGMRKPEMPEVTNRGVVTTGNTQLPTSGQGEPKKALADDTPPTVPPDKPKPKAEVPSKK